MEYAHAAGAEDEARGRSVCHKRHVAELLHTLQLVSAITPMCAVTVKTAPLVEVDII